jgi:hypothetical protein
MMATGLLLVLALQDPDALIQQLGSDDFALRNKAAQSLIEMGPPILGKLKTRQEEGDAEIRVRIKQIINEIRWRDRLTLIRPKPNLLTLSLKDEVLPDALRKVFNPYGFDAKFPEDDSGARGRKVTLDLKDATLWQAFDAICSNAHVKLDYLWVPRQPFTNGDGGISLRPHGDVGELRFMAEHFIHEGKHKVQVSVGMPTAYLPMHPTVEGIMMVDEEGHRIVVQAETKTLTIERRKGEITEVFLCDTVISPKCIKDWKTVRVEGIYTQEYPKSLEITVIDIREAGKVATAFIHGCKVTAQWTREKSKEGIPPEVDPRFVGEWETAPKFLNMPLFIWIEDANGHWLADGRGFDISRSGTSGASGVFYGKLNAEAPPATFVAAIAEGTDVVKTPFVINGFDEPRKR